MGLELVDDHDQEHEDQGPTPPPWAHYSTLRDGKRHEVIVKEDATGQRGHEIGTFERFEDAAEAVRSVTRRHELEAECEGLRVELAVMHTDKRPDRSAMLLRGQMWMKEDHEKHQAAAAALYASALEEIKAVTETADFWKRSAERWREEAALLTEECDARQKIDELRRQREAKT